MYKYSKGKDEICYQKGKTEYPCFLYGTQNISHEMLECLREALGLKKKKQQKYTIHLFPGECGFLNQSIVDDWFLISGRHEFGPNKTHFTLAEIDKLKQRDDIAIDWNKAKIEPVNDDE